MSPYDALVSCVSLVSSVCDGPQLGFHRRSSEPAWPLYYRLTSRGRRCSSHHEDCANAPRKAACLCLYRRLCWRISFVLSRHISFLCLLPHTELCPEQSTSDSVALGTAQPLTQIRRRRAENFGHILTVSVSLLEYSVTKRNHLIGRTCQLLGLFLAFTRGGSCHRFSPFLKLAVCQIPCKSLTCPVFGCLACYLQMSMIAVTAMITVIMNYLRFGFNIRYAHLSITVSKILLV